MGSADRGDPIKRRVVLSVRDGWGANPHPAENRGNAILLGETPNTNRLMAEYPHVLIHTSGEHVGLSEGTMGNSEVGHQNIGAGRIVNQEVMRITGRIRDGSFFENAALCEAADRATGTGGCVHMMGLASDIGVHSVLDHLYAVVELCKRRGVGADKVVVVKAADPLKEVPKFRGTSCRKAKKKIVELGFKVGKVRWRVYDAPPYLVMRQSPDPGTKAKPGPPIDLTCSQEE